MKFVINKDILQEELSIASKFALSRTNAIPSLQGGLIHIKDGRMHIVTTNLNDYYSSYLTIKTTDTEEKRTVINIRKVVEFLQFLPSGDIEIELDKNMIIKSNKTVATFDVISAVDFPPLPQVEGEKHILTKEFLEKNIPLVLFSVSHDETRPVLTGVNFISRNDKNYIVSTDGFRLSLIEYPQDVHLPQAVISANILDDLIHLFKKDIHMMISAQKIVKFEVKDRAIYTRLIEGEFPEFERVIPTSYKTRVVMDHDELLRNIKLSSVFARDFSSVIVVDVQKDGVYIKPKVKEEKGTVIYQEAQIEGEEQKIAFNFKFVLDFLNNITSKKVIFEISAGNAPGVLRTEDNKNFIHIIMPIRTD